VGNTERRTGSSSQVANTKSQVTDNSASTESRVTPNSANTESLVTQNATSVESHITENSANVENRVMQHSREGGQETEIRKRCCPKQKVGSMVVPKGYYQDTKMQIARDASKRVG
jgi:hypothetical protein